MASALLGAGGDPAASRLVYSIVTALVALGVGLIVLTAWLVRRSRPDLELLEPLELMATRSWRRLDPAGRRRLLDEHRPAGAEPLDRATIEPAVDESFEHIAEPRDFDDLAADPVTSSDERTAEDAASEHRDESDPPTGPDPAGAVARRVEPVADPPRDSDADVVADRSTAGDDAGVEDGAAADAADVDGETSEIEDDGDGEDETSEIAADDVDGEDDTGEIEGDDALMVPILPGEGLLRRPKHSDE